MAMATSPTADRAYFQILEEALRNSNLPNQQRQQLWEQAAALHNHNALNNNTQPAQPSQVPRSMSTITQPPTLDTNSMDRTLSAPAFVPMGRSISSHPAGPRSNGALPQRCLSPASWGSQGEEQTSSYTLTSQPTHIQKQPSLQTIDEMVHMGNEGMVEYDPADYVSNCIEPAGSAPLSLSHSHDPSRLQVQLTQDSQWSPSTIDGSISPSTPSSAALMTPVSISDSNMSRQTSFNPQFFDENLMLRVQSDSSCVFAPLLSEDGSPISFPFDVTAKNISACVDTSLFPSFTGSSEVFPSPAQLSSSASVLESSQQQPYLVDDMRRSASTSGESNSSNASASSTSARQSRLREINAQASRKIAPRVIESNDETKSASSNIKMRRVLSEDGSSKEVAPITKAPYVRPQHAKVSCQYCNARPNGFRGTHELDRHIARAHAKIRKGYICVDSSPDRKFLANCKHCRNKKVYGAYYNAAAHLRRAHFHPRKRGRKGKNDQKRGGIGGGDDPPMDHLKQHWIEEVDVPCENKYLKQAASDNCSTSFSEDSPIDSGNTTESYEYELMDNAADMPNMLDFNHGFDANVFMHSNDSSFDSMPQLTAFPDPNQATFENFQFDAYVTQ